MVADSQPGHIDQIKQTNAGAVYRLIDQLGPVSRIDLSRFAQLAPASITKIVREMLEAHLVQETEIQEPGSRGRPAVGLMVETEAWHYLSLRIRPRSSAPSFNGTICSRVLVSRVWIWTSGKRRRKVESVSETALINGADEVKPMRSSPVSP